MAKDSYLGNTTVVRLILTYGSTAWWPAVKRVDDGLEPNKIQQSHVQVLLGVYPVRWMLFIIINGAKTGIGSRRASERHSRHVVI